MEDPDACRSREYLVVAVVQLSPLLRSERSTSVALKFSVPKDFFKISSQLPGVTKYPEGSSLFFEKTGSPFVPNS
jgi:hypothetical protein